MRQQSDDGRGIRQDRQSSIIAFEGLDEGLRDAIDSGERTGVKQSSDLRPCGVECVLGDVSRAVVGQPFDGMRRLADPEPTLDASDHQIAHISPEIPAVVASQAMISRSQASRRTAPNDLAITAGELEVIGAPADIPARGPRRLMRAPWPAAGMPF